MLKALGTIFSRWRLRRATKQRLLFQYHDGKQTRYGDPFGLWRALHAHPTLNLERDADALDRGEEPAATQAITALCQIFGVQRWNEQTGRGLTDWEVCDLIVQLQQYLDALKKNTSAGPTSPEPTGLPSSTGQEAPGTPPSA